MLKELTLYGEVDKVQRACCRAYEKRVADGLETKWKDGNEIYSWWIGEANYQRDDEDEKLISLFGLMGDESML